MFASRAVKASGRAAVAHVARTLVTGSRAARVPAALRYSRTFKSIITPVRFYSDDNTATLKVDNPQLMIAFTCKKCDTRSSHTFLKQAYQKGTVLIQCPGCKGRHLIADNLKIFKDNKFNLEDVLKAKGESVAATTEDLVFEDIPESLRDTIGHHAKDAPEDHLRKAEVRDNSLPSGKK